MFTIFGQKSNLKNFEVSDPVDTSSHGCMVIIRDVIKDFEIWAANGFADKVRDVFARQLYDDPSFRIIYDGVAVDAREAIASVTRYPIAIDQRGRTLERPKFGYASISGRRKRLGPATRSRNGLRRRSTLMKARPLIRSRSTSGSCLMSSP
jgi:hypothetical protein